MRKYNFNAENCKFAKPKKKMVLLRDDDETLFLGLEDSEGSLTSKIKVLPISKITNLTNFFIRGFNIQIEGLEDIPLTIPEEDLMEVERKIIVTDGDADERTKQAEEKLQEKFKGKLNKENYSRTMIYLDNENNDLANNNMVFRLTQEKDVVKATIHMGNNLPGDQKQIIKFFFKDTNLDEVKKFFEEALSVKPITREINSTRTEYKSGFGEVSFDKFKDEFAEYSVVELELDKLKEENDDSERMTKKGIVIAGDLGLDGCSVVDKGTEAIFEEVSGIPFFTAYRVPKRKRDVDFEEK